MNFSGEEDQTCYDINRLRKPDSTFDRGYYYSSLSTKYQKGCLKKTHLSFSLLVMNKLAT